MPLSPFFSLYSMEDWTQASTTEPLFSLTSPSLFIEIGSQYVALTGLELTVYQTGLKLNRDPSMLELMACVFMPGTSII